MPKGVGYTPEYYEQRGALMHRWRQRLCRRRRVARLGATCLAAAGNPARRSASNPERAGRALPLQRQ